MSATPQNGTLTFIGKSGRIYNVDIYISDVAGSQATFNASGSAGASSLAYWRSPEDVSLIDYAMVTGTADTKGIVLSQDGATRNGAVLRYANFLNSLNKRTAVNVNFPAGALIGAIQF